MKTRVSDKQQRTVCGIMSSRAGVLYEGLEKLEAAEG